MMVRVGIVGASGYTGLELIKLLITHNGFDLCYIATSKGETDTVNLHPSLQSILHTTVEQADTQEIVKRCDLVFLALPHQTAMEFAKKLLDHHVAVVDLSADYRLKQETYEKNYCPHIDPNHLSMAVYALIEYTRDALRNTKLAACPGCYPTATLLALLPLIPYIDTNAPIFIDAKSGVSGAGKKLSETTHFVTINENLFAYNPIHHRHAPEIAEKIEQFCAIRPTNINFVPHLIPATRGELVSIYATLKKEIDPIRILQERYRNEPFIRVRQTPPDIKAVAGTHFCDLFGMRNGSALYLSASIDNLLRGAASQALAAANLMCGFEETQGLPKIAYVP